MRGKVENCEADVTLHKRLLERTNQPTSYLLADVERCEKELDHAQRTIKKLEAAHRNLTVENEQLRQSKKAINEDLQMLIARRADIENLQTTLMGLIRNSTNRKIDIDDLKASLATTVRRNKFSNESSHAVKSEKENVMKKMNKEAVIIKGSHHEAHGKVPMYEKTDTGATPAWYKALKKNISSK